MNPTLRRNLLPLLPLPALLLPAPAPAAAQIVLGGGRVVIGSPPPWDYNKHYLGHGNYPGGDGFTPGYGYYPFYSDDPDRPPRFRHFRGHAHAEAAPAAPVIPAPPEALPPG